MRLHTMTAAAGGHPSDPVVPRSARIFRRLIVLAAVVGGAVLAMAWNDRSAVNSETRGASQIARSDEVLEGSYSLERRLVDLETGLRGFEATDDRLFLQPWDAARSLIPIELTHLQGIAETAAQRNRVRELGAAIAAYIANYAAPITRERAAPRGTALVGSFARGKRLFDALRRRFDEIDDAELALRASRGRHARSIAATVNITTLVAAGVVMIAVAALLLYVFRAVIIPLRRLIAACARLSGGDRGIRLPAPNSELGDVSRAFNAMVLELQIHEHDLEDALAKVRDLADRDGLTGLLNRRAFHVALDGAIGRVTRYAEHGTVLMIDLDKFKAVNDTHGHAVGDELLRRVGEALRSLLRNSDVCGRLGGDEFAVILPHTGVAEAEIVAEKLRGAIRSIALGAPAVHAVSASVGIAELGPDANLTAAEVLLRADMAMYRAKHGGRDRTALASLTSAPGLPG